MTPFQRALALLSALLGWSCLAAGGKLIFDDVFAHSPVFVYELPESENRPEAVRYVETMRDRFKPGALLIDASVNEGALKGQLKNGFVLFSTLGEKSRLLNLATRGLQWTWRDLPDGASDTRLFLVGRNPYSKGNCVIFAAASNGALIEMNSEAHGRASYDLYSKGRLLGEGDFDENYAPRAERIPKPAALEDVAQFFRTLERVHPNLTARVSPESYRKMKEQTAADIAAGASADLSQAEFASKLYLAAAFLRDGHTSVNWQTSPNELNTAGKKFPPFNLRFADGHFFITTAKNRTIRGLELVRVNGTPVAEFFQPILDRCSGELLGFRAARFLDDEPFWYSMTNLFGGDGPFVLTLRDANGRDRETRVDTLPFKEYREGRAEPYRPDQQGTRVEFFDSGATAHMLYESFDDSPEARAEVDRAFDAMKSAGAKNLILDLRGNRGAHSGMGEFLFSYFYGGKFRSHSRVKAKASRDMLPLAPAWARPLALILQGHVIEHSIAEHAPPRPGAFFDGHVYVLIDNGSYSMATEFAAMVRDYKAATLMGYETGGTAITFGGAVDFTLKNSGIECSVSSTRNFPSVPRPDDEEHGVMPDVPIGERMLADFAAEEDPVLAFALRYIRQN